MNKIAIRHHKIVIKKNTTKNSGTQRKVISLFPQDKGKNGENRRNMTIPPRRPAISTYKGLKKREKSTDFMG